MRRLPVPNIYGNLFSVAQKVVAITGAGQGIGLALAEGFAAAGANVVLVDLNAETLAQARTKVEKISKHVTSVMTDVSADGAPAKIVAASKALGGRVDCLINNAGIMSYTDSRTITDDEFDRMIKINLKAPIRIMKAVLYEMESQGSGSIINIGSSWSSRASVFNQSGGGGSTIAQLRRRFKPTRAAQRRTSPRNVSASTRSRQVALTRQCMRITATSSWSMKSIFRSAV